MKKQAIIAATAAALAITIGVSGNAIASSNVKQHKQQANIAMCTYTDDNDITYVGTNKDNMIALYCECGTCGAHITSWHYVHNYDMDKVVPVCDYCYDIALEEDKANER